MKKILMIVSIIGTLTFADTNPVKTAPEIFKMLLARDMNGICDHLVALSKKLRSEGKYRGTINIVRKKDCMKDLK